jgi:glycosyltransferase involved in cell wall biosynthesis
MVHGDPQGGAVRLTIVMPCLNEAETLEGCIVEARGFLEGNGIDGEVLIADNGSTDGSQEIARAAGARVVDVPERGYGAALIAGIAAARGRYVAMGDADGSYDFSSLGPFLAALDEGADLVMGDRFAGGIQEGAMPPLHRYLGNPVLSWLGRRFFGVKVRDFHCGLRAFRRDRILELGLSSPGMEFASEMVARASMAGYRIEEVPTILRPDGRTRAPHLRTWRDGWRHLRFLLLYSPRWLFLYPGLVLLVAGLVLGLLIELKKATIGSVTFDVDALVGALGLVLVGVQAVLLHLLTSVFSARIGLRPLGPRMRRLVSGRSLEMGIGIGIVMVLGGVALLVVDVVEWSHLRFGDLNASSQLRLTVPAVALVVVGVQLVLNAFFLAILGIRTRGSTAASVDVEVVEDVRADGA